MTQNVYWLLQVNIKDSQQEIFKSLMEEMVSSTQNESGTLFYEWWINDEGTTCHIYERFADSDATMVHIGNFGSNFAERFMGCVDPSGITVYGSPSDAVKEALAAFGPAYMNSYGGFSR